VNTPGLLRRDLVQLVSNLGRDAVTRIRVNHRIPLQQQTDALGCNQLAQHFLYFRGHILQQGLACGLLSFLQLASHLFKVGLLVGQFLAGSDLLLLE